MILLITVLVSPYLNGCDVRLKWPGYFLNSDLNTIFDLFLERGYKIDILSDPRERAVGLFPKHITELDIHNNRYDLEKYLDNLVIEDDHFIFLCLPQFHWTLDAFGASLNGEKKALKDYEKSLPKPLHHLTSEEIKSLPFFSYHPESTPEEIFAALKKKKAKVSRELPGKENKLSHSQIHFASKIKGQTFFQC